MKTTTRSQWFKFFSTAAVLATMAGCGATTTATYEGQGRVSESNCAAARQGESYTIQVSGAVTNDSVSLQITDMRDASKAQPVFFTSFIRSFGSVSASGGSDFSSGLKKVASNGAASVSGSRSPANDEIFSVIFDFRGYPLDVDPATAGAVPNCTIKITGTNLKVI